VKSHNGFIIFCRSLTGKFKLVIFDSNGEVIHIDEAIRSRDGSQWESSLYFLSAFSMFRLSPPLPAAIREQDLPPVFNSLDSFTQCNMSLASGQYLVCVYGDNFIGKTSYSLLAVPTLNDCQEVYPLSLSPSLPPSPSPPPLCLSLLTLLFCPVLLSDFRQRMCKSSTRLCFKRKRTSPSSNLSIFRFPLPDPPSHLFTASLSLSLSLCLSLCLSPVLPHSGKRELRKSSQESPNGI
jgi:hypothetical protein